MVKHLIASFLFSFSGILMLVALYVWVPQYVSEHFGRKSTTPIASRGPSPTPSPTPGLTPVTLLIPKLNIQTAIEPVGLTATENMDVPKNANNAAWYMYGPPPSQLGNAVIAAHYDTPTGRPAIFYNLKKLVPGDTVEVISVNGVHSVFLVEEVSSLPYDTFPSDFVFKARPGRNLNLITCSGIWDAKKKVYSNRIVVYTVLNEDGHGQT